jgi:hypothetical protein
MYFVMLSLSQAQVLSDTAAQKKLSKVNHKKDIDVPVMFFGTLEIAWINKADIVPFTDGIHKGFLAKGKQKNFQRAVEQVIVIILMPKGPHAALSSKDLKYDVSTLLYCRSWNSWLWAKREKPHSTGGARLQVSMTGV